MTRQSSPAPSPWHAEASPSDLLAACENARILLLALAPAVPGRAETIRAAVRQIDAAVAKARGQT